MTALTVVLQSASVLLMLRIHIKGIEVTEWNSW